jgi:hypothetical protein
MKHGSFFRKTLLLVYCVVALFAVLIVTIYTAMSEKARKIYRAISEFLSNVSSASQLGIEERRQRIIAHAFREYGTIRRLFPPDIGGQMTIPLA